MARGPFQGTYQSGIRPTVVTAPDALVYINGELEVQGCPSCKRRFDLNKFITSIQTSLDVESAPGSASISLSIPRHSIDDFYFEGDPVIVPMMEVEIFAKGYFLVEGLPQYYPIFWGLVTEVNEGYSTGENTVSINCADILKWWELCRMNVNPAFTQAVGQMGRSIFGNVFYGSNPFDVIWTLAQQSFGDVVIGTGSLTSLYKEGQQKRTFSRTLTDLMLYWTERFSRIRSNMLLYGTQGVAIRGDILYDTFRSGKGGQTVKKPYASRAVRQANGGPLGGQMVYDPTDPMVVAYRTQFTQAGQVNFWQSEYQTKLEIANHTKETIGYEFYMDVTGDIVFKPPFYNLDVLANKPVSWIQDIDIIDLDLTDSESEVVTQVTVQGNFGGNTDYGFSEEVTPFTSVTDYHLLRQYGWRPQPFNSEFLGDTTLMFYTGMDILDRFNSRRHRGTVNIPLRPELRLGFPVYVAPKDQFWYVKGISHNIAFGGRAQTTLTLTARRRKFIAPKGMGTLKMTAYAAPPSAKQQQAQQGANPGQTPPEGATGGGAPAKGGNQPGGTGGGQAASNPAAGKPQYTARQLAANATFSLKSGGAAEMPGDPFADGGATTTDPYAPVLLRHPKTGRILGWPNAVMIYTRPFAANPDTLAAMEGHKSGKGSGKNAYANRELAAVSKAGPGTFQELGRQVQATQEDVLDGKHVVNRYSYGLTSAGVYIYAHDQSKVIQEFLLISKAKVLDADKSQGTTSVFQGKTGMIRPISDDRGFEVIGHFRYGRGVQLRDGSLILTDNGINAKADVATQISLTGNLTSALIAQSQGLTTIISAYPNPAETVSKLVPEDMQTAAIQTPEMRDPEYVPSAANFVDAAPLGSPEQEGLPPSIEVSQLSHALTLAEMNVRIDDKDAQACSCLMARSELAFMNTGYQVKTLLGTAPEPGARDVLSDLSGDYDYAKAIEEGRPVSQAVYQGSQSMMNKVDEFLFKLYSDLDIPHQQYEAALRGTKLAAGTEGNIDPENVRFGTSPGAFGPLDPPYSAPSRFAAGDPAAALQQYSSARADIKQQWEAFGDNLQAAAEKAKLDQEITNLNRDIAQLQKALAQAEAALASGTGSQAEVDRLNAALNGSGSTFDTPSGTSGGKIQELQNKQLERSNLG